MIINPDILPICLYSKLIAPEMQRASDHIREKIHSDSCFICLGLPSRVPELATAMTRSTSLEASFFKIGAYFSGTPPD